jgi:phage-related tail protein
MRKEPMRKLIIAALAITSVAGCKRGESAVTARANFCKQLSEYRAALAEVPPLEATTQVSSVRRSLDRVRREYRDLAQEAKRLDAARARDLERAQENFDRAVRAVPGKATLGEARTKLSGPAAELRAASEQMSASVQCPGGATGRY